MVEFDLKWENKAIMDFVKFYTFKKNKLQRNLIVILAALAVLASIFSLIAFFITKEPMLLMGFGLCVFMVLVYMLLFYHITRGIAKDLVKANAENNGMSALFSIEAILLKKDKKPFSIINWEDVGEIYLSKNAAYLLGKNNALLLISYSDINFGKLDEFISLLNEKKENLVTDEVKA